MDVNAEFVIENIHKLLYIVLRIRIRIIYRIRFCIAFYPDPDLILEKHIPGLHRELKDKNDTCRLIRQEALRLELFVERCIRSQLKNLTLRHR